jgi:hypothetical protein
MQEYTMAPVTVRGVEFAVTVDYRGWFHARANGFREVSADTLARMTDQLKVVTSQARVKVSVPFTQLDGNGKVIRGVATGIHNGNDAILVRYESGKTAQFSRYGGGGVCGELTEAEAAEWSALYLAARDANQAEQRFSAEHRLELREKVQAAVNVAAAADSAGAA